MSKIKSPARSVPEEVRELFCFAQRLVLRMLLWWARASPATATTCRTGEPLSGLACRTIALDTYFFHHFSWRAKTKTSKGDWWGVPEGRRGKQSIEADSPGLNTEKRLEELGFQDQVARFGFQVALKRRVAFPSVQSRETEREKGRVEAE